jgi:ABC-2 type transport system ATP-binding protein
MLAMVETKQLSKNYKHNRGVHDMNMAIQQGEVVGIVGKNGAGKTTTMRMLMGFIHPSKGSAAIRGMDAWSKAAKTKPLIGYVPGEIAFPDTKSGATFLQNELALLRANKDEYVNELIQRFKIDLTADLRRMSKGMKQKTALVCAFMTKPPLLLLDEPTTGLDPVMRDAFIDLILQVKAQGTTVFLSSHMFNELERTCDRIMFLKDGQVIDVLDESKFAEIHAAQRVTIVAATNDGFERLLTSEFELVRQDPVHNTVVLLVPNTVETKLLHLLGEVKLTDVSFDTQTLDNYFEKELEL